MIEVNCIDNPSLSETADYCKAIANKKKKKFIPMQTRDSLWKTYKLKFKQIADIIIDCPKLSPNAFTAYCYMFKQNPCRPSLAEIEKRLNCGKKITAEVIQELVARKLIQIKEKGSGPTSNLYEFILDPKEWDLTSDTDSLIKRKKRVFKGALSGMNRTPLENLVVSTVPHKKLSGMNRTPQNDLSGMNRTPLENLVVSTVPHKGGTNIRLSHKTNYEINLNETKAEDGLGLIAGPPTSEKQMELSLKTLIHGNKQDNERFSVKVSKESMTSDRIEAVLGGLLVWGQN